MNGTIDGQFGDHILIAPPFIITGDQIDKFAHAARYAGTA
jgi:adenosylmethionine-8-amino-7-oxononanoate aminotransferase